MDVKCTFVGDQQVGKSSLIMSYYRNLTFKLGDVPCNFDSEEKEVQINNKLYNLECSDTNGSKGHRNLRPISYPKTNVFLICFSISDVNSFRNCSNIWFPELQRYLPSVPIVLVGLKSDLRDNFEDECYYNKSNFITYKEGELMANYIGAASYIEFSSKNMSGIDELFETLVIVGTSFKRNMKNDDEEVFEEIKNSIGKINVYAGSYYNDIENDRTNKDTENCIIC